MREPHKRLQLEPLPFEMFDNPKFDSNENGIKRLGHRYISVVVKIPKVGGGKSRALLTCAEAPQLSPPQQDASTFPAEDRKGLGGALASSNPCAQLFAN